MTRITKFNKNLSIFKSNPDYEDVKNVYLTNDAFTLSSARKLLNMVKYTNKGIIKKSSINSKKKFDEELNKYKLIIKDGQTVDQMNKAINQALTKTNRNTATKLLDKKQINSLLKNLNPTHKYTLKIKTKKETKYFTINPETKGFVKILTDDVIAQEIAGNTSDAWINTEYVKINNIEIQDITDPFIDDNNKMNRNVGRFKSYNLHCGVDLSKYQIYKKDEKIDRTNCLIYSLKMAGVDENLINNVIIKFSSNLSTENNEVKTDIYSKTFEYIKITDFEEVAKIINRKIDVTVWLKNGICKQTQKQIFKQRINKYGKKIESDLDSIKLAIYDNHIFINEETIYKKFAIENYNKLIESNTKHEWFNYGNFDKTTYGSKLTSFEVVRLLDDLQMFEKIPLEIDLNDNVELFTSAELLENLENDQQLFEYEAKEPKETKIYFADLENINHTDKLSVPFLAGIISHDDIEPKIYDGLDCVEKMLDYIVAKNNFKKINVLYFHNMKYDFNLMKSTNTITIENICDKDNNIYSVNIIYKKVKIILKDSYKVFANKLEKFGTAFNLPAEIRKKEAIGYDYYTMETINEKLALIETYKQYVKKSDIKTFEENIKPFIFSKNSLMFDHIGYYKHYLKYDCLVLQKGMIAYNKCMNDTFGKPIFNFLTISSYADYYFKSRGVYDGIFEVSGGLKKFLSKAVYGGRVNVCPKFRKKVIRKRINDFDGVSLYPSAIYRLCKEYGIPIGKAKRYNKNDDIRTKDYYVVEIEITKINKKQSNPFIALKTKESIKYINEIPENGLVVVIDRFTLEDYVKFHQIEYNILDGVYWDEGFNKKFLIINDVFQERLIQKAKKTAEGDIKQELYKLILNSAYGKTLLKSSCEKDKIITKDDFNKYMFNNFNTIKHAKEINDKQFLITQYEADKSFNRTHCGVAILSMSKRIMNEVMNEANDADINIYYQDTDSMHIDDDKIQRLADLYKEKYQKELIGKGLGQFHNDFAHKNKLCVDVVSIKSIFLGKKAYIDYLEGTLPDGKKDYCIHARMKGINEISLHNKANEYTGEFIDNVFQIYENLSDDKSIEFILNPDEKPSFIFTSSGVKKREANKFKRIVSFK